MTFSVSSTPSKREEKNQFAPELRVTLAMQRAMASAARSLFFLGSARRTFATISTNLQSELAQASSAPLKVQERREKTQTEFARSPKDGRALSREEKRAMVRPHVSRNSERGRLRGVRTVRRADGTVDEQIVGQRIYLPNILFTLVRNHTPPGQAYNPYEVTFYVPPNITKTDVRAYLNSIYGVECTYIRSDNYHVPIKEKKYAESGMTETKNMKRTHKRVVVGLKQPFYYPRMMEDMNGKERWLRESTLEELFQIKRTEETMKALRIKLLENRRENDVADLAQRWDSRKKILRKLYERREERERAVREMAKQLEEGRE